MNYMPHIGSDQVDSSVFQGKVCAVVQGNIRLGTEEVLSCLARHVDHVVLSTWSDQPDEKIPRGNWDVVLNPKPAVPGYSNRNYQRFSTATGLRRAAQLGATHVLKWRTDMLPTKLDVPQLLTWSNYDVAAGMGSRLVTCAFRNLSVRQDWFSTIPDLFSFADVALMSMLWSDDSFDYSSNMNIPQELLEECGSAWTSRPDVDGLYCPEAELYALFKSRLEQRLSMRLTHPVMAKNYMRLVDHRHLGICWFGESGQFRSITQALQHPWWTEAIWLNDAPKIAEWGYPETTWLQKFRRKHLTRLVSRHEIKQAHKWYEAYKN